MSKVVVLETETKYAVLLMTTEKLAKLLDDTTSLFERLEKDGCEFDQEEALIIEELYHLKEKLR